MDISGFYKVAFSALQPGAGGVVVLENGNIRGADDAYLYSGAYVESSIGVTATLRVKAHSPHAQDVFGGMGGSFELSLIGAMTAKGFMFTGKSPRPGSPPISIRGTKVGSLDLQ